MGGYCNIVCVLCVKRSLTPAACTKLFFNSYPALYVLRYGIRYTQRTNSVCIIWYMVHNNNNREIFLKLWCVTLGYFCVFINLFVYIPYVRARYLHIILMYMSEKGKVLECGCGWSETTTPGDKKDARRRARELISYIKSMMFLRNSFCFIKKSMYVHDLVNVIETFSLHSYSIVYMMW